MVARVSKDGKLFLQKGPIPPSHHKVKVEVYPRYAVRAAPETAPTPLNAWTGVDAGGVRLVVVYSYLAMMPAEVLCLLCPQVGRCKLELSSDDMTANFSTLISAGLPPNQLRGLMPNEVRANRGDFFKAFMHTLVTLDPDKRSAMLDGSVQQGQCTLKRAKIHRRCQDLFVSVMTLHPGTEAARVAQEELVIRNQRENLMIGYALAAEAPLAVGQPELSSTPQVPDANLFRTLGPAAHSEAPVARRPKARHHSHHRGQDGLVRRKGYEEPQGATLQRERPRCAHCPRSCKTNGPLPAPSLLLPRSGECQTGTLLCSWRWRYARCRLPAPVPPI